MSSVTASLARSRPVAQRKNAAGPSFDFQPCRPELIRRTGKTPCLQASLQPCSPACSNAIIECRDGDMGMRARCPGPGVRPGEGAAWPARGPPRSPLLQRTSRLCRCAWMCTCPVCMHYTATCLTKACGRRILALQAPELDASLARVLARLPGFRPPKKAHARVPAGPRHDGTSQQRQKLGDGLVLILRKAAELGDEALLQVRPGPCEQAWPAHAQERALARAGGCFC